METIDAALKEGCQRYGAQVALRQKVDGLWLETSHRELLESAERVAAGLVQHGFQTGDHAALMGGGSPRWVASFLGILRAGGVVIPIDKELKSAELRHVLSDCGAKLIFVDPPYLDLVLECVPVLPKLEQIILLHRFSVEVGDPQIGSLLEALAEEWRALVAACQVPPDRVARLEQLAGQLQLLLSPPQGRNASPGEGKVPFVPTVPTRKPGRAPGKVLPLDDLLVQEELPPSSRTASDTAVILYTSGTTGRAKGAMLSHENILSNLAAIKEHLRLDSTIHTLSYLPINHVFELVAGVLLPLYLGGRITFAESLKKLGDNLAEVKPTFLLGVPAVYKMILDRIRKKVASQRVSRMLFAFPLTRQVVAKKVQQAFGSGTIFISGGAALDPAIAHGLLEFGITIYQGYGITETSPVISAEQPGRTRLGSVGHALPGVELRIAAPNEEGVGEILVHGSNVMQGYYNNPTATGEALQDGWYRTGDLGRIDLDGYLSICGRVKNLIVTSNGKNVYPEEVENELLKSPFIAEVMVYGHQVEALAEEVRAVIFPNQDELDAYAQRRGKGPLTPAQVESLLREEVLAAGKGLADYKRVRRFTLRYEEFPKTSTRKIKRYDVHAGISVPG